VVFNLLLLKSVCYSRGFSRSSLKHPRCDRSDRLFSRCEGIQFSVMESAYPSLRVHFCSYGHLRQRCDHESLLFEFHKEKQRKGVSSHALKQVLLVVAVLSANQRRPLCLLSYLQLKTIRCPHCLCWKKSLRKVKGRAPVSGPSKLNIQIVSYRFSANLQWGLPITCKAPQIVRTYCSESKILKGCARM
jgi:hypothetical protein